MGKGSSRQFPSGIAPYERPPTNERPSRRPTPAREPQRSSRVVIASPSYIIFIKKLKFGPGAFWSLPGGRREPGEKDALQTAYRETAEEVCLRLGKRHALCVWEEARKNWRNVEDLVLFFLSDEFILSTPPEGDENGDPLEVRVFRRDEIPSIAPFNANHRDMLATALAYLEDEGL